MANWTITKNIRIGVTGNVLPVTGQRETPFMIYGFATFTSDTGEVINDFAAGSDLDEGQFNDYCSKRLAALIARDTALAGYSLLTGDVEVEPYVKPDPDPTAVALLAAQKVLNTAARDAQVRALNDTDATAALEVLKAAETQAATAITSGTIKV